ncbi:hypothetical protein [Romboutsia sp.]|uniref:hypothetical protein n=1 Tax=Romboutsia sp. TaxID=1965302 RepID=UPI003F2BE4CD
MYKKIILGILTMFIVLSSGITSNCINNPKTYKNDIWINNLSNKDVKIKITKIKVSEEKIDVGEVYGAYAIITMDVKNYGQDNIELANLNVYPYQGDKPTKYFVSTSKDNIEGFIGSLRNNERKTVKMGVTLYNTKEPIKLVFTNVEDVNNEKVTKTINIK